MIFERLPLEGAYVIRLVTHEDDRGFFARTWCKKEFQAHGLAVDMVQGNTAFSRQRGTLRGMHFQVPPYGEAKLIRCIRGAIYDVMIDLRPGSPTCYTWYGIELDERSFRMVYVPEGFAHGYLTLRDDTEVTYQVSQFYSPDAESGIRWNDPLFNIRWPVVGQLILSAKDRGWPDFSAQGQSSS
jgi:dTDP-4-dehydrorhamnose 3,5-epimerase